MMSDPVQGIVSDVGGGEVRVLVDRDTESYPPVGQHVAIVPVPPAQRTGNPAADMLATLGLVLSVFAQPIPEGALILIAGAMWDDTNNDLAAALAKHAGHSDFLVMLVPSREAVLQVLAPVEGWRRNASARWPHRSGVTVHALQPECDTVLPRCLPVYAPVCPSCGRPSHDGVVEPTGVGGPDAEQVCDGSRLLDRPEGVYGATIPPDDESEPF